MERVLYVMHSTSLIYGASKSLSELLRNVDYEFDLVFPKSTSNNISDQDIRKHFGKNLKNIFRFWLPYEKVFLGKSKSDYLSLNTYKYYLKQLISYIDIFKIRGLAKRYNYIYLNSITLYPIINKKSRYFIHIREIYSGSSFRMKFLVRKLNSALGIIFIDNSTFEPFINKVNNYIILNNPFDMRNVRDIEKEKILHELHIKQNTIIVSILGKITELKGIRFIIEAFSKINRDEMILLIVGDVNNPYADYCKKMSIGTDKIHFLGELTDVEPIYAISDYILRGDPVFAIGRTIYEGLYSGCNVIIPGTENNAKDIFQYLTFKEKIHFYFPRDQESLLKILNNCRKNSILTDYPISNIDCYISSHREFISESLGWKM
jgi:glycosyltransferase involved in cell wall biosynthesis